MVFGLGALVITWWDYEGHVHTNFIYVGPVKEIGLLISRQSPNAVVDLAQSGAYRQFLTTQLRRNPVSTE
jgi:hypothetical protein